MIRNFKFATVAALLALSVPTGTYAQEAEAVEADTSSGMGGEKELLEMFAKIFGGNENAPPIDPAQLALAEVTAGKILPDGTMEKMMGGMFDSILSPLLGFLPDMSVVEIMDKTGVYDGAVGDLDEAKRKEITALLDPVREERGKKTLEVMKPLLNEAMTALEGPMRTGLSRAYSRKFSAQQLGEINAFFATPAGSFYASESYALQADPEVMQATFQAVPVIIQKVMHAVPAIEAQMKELPKERSLKDLDDTELEQLAGLLGVARETLEENREAMAEGLEAVADAAEAAADAVADATEFPYANETGEEPWYDDANWEASERQDISKLSDAHDAASKKNSEAYAAWEAAFDAAVAKSRAKYLSAGWKPEASGDSDED